MEIVKRCEQITLDYERGKFQRLSVKDRIEGRFHLSICPKCRKYVMDSQKLDLWLRRRFSQIDIDHHFSQVEKESIKAKLRKN